MTRINCIPPEELSRQHLLAEYRELPRLRHATAEAAADKLPVSYRLGTGHCKFFYNKGLYLIRRHAALIKEMLARGYKPALPPLSLSWADERMQDWKPTEEDKRINRERIQERNGNGKS